MTRIYYASISEEAHSFLMQKYSTSFSDTFSKRLLRYRRWQDAQLSLLGRLLLKHAFEIRETPFPFEEIVLSKFRKPLLINHPLKFNISHSVDIAICVVTDAVEVGIDIELVEPVKVEEFKSQMTKGEWMKVVTSRFIDQAFYTYWTQKEAVLKACGKGLSVPLKSFEVINNKCYILDDFFYTQKIYVGNNYKCHLAFENKLDPDILPAEKIFFHL